MAHPPVILLHGWGGSFRATYEQVGWVESLRAIGRETHAIDLPGHEAVGASHNLGDYRDLASALFQKISQRRIDVIAYSLGAKLALELACRHQNLIGRMVLGGIGDNAFAPEASGEAVATALESGLSQSASPIVRGLVAYTEASGCDPLALAAVLRRAPNPVANATRLSKIDADILIVNGEEDMLAQPDKRLRDALPKAQYLALPGVDHFSLPSDLAFRRAAIGFVQLKEGST